MKLESRAWYVFGGKAVRPFLGLTLARRIYDLEMRVSADG